MPEDVKKPRKYRAQFDLEGGVLWPFDAESDVAARAVVERFLATHNVGKTAKLRVKYVWRLNEENGSQRRIYPAPKPRGPRRIKRIAFRSLTQIGGPPRG